MSDFRQAYVYVDGCYAGLLQEDEEGYSFTYEDSYFAGSNKPVSLTLPLTKQVYHSHVLFPFFDGLIPEGWLLSVLTRNWKLNEKDRFGILLAACRDCIGNVSIMREKI